MTYIPSHILSSPLWNEEKPKTKMEAYLYISINADEAKKLNISIRTLAHSLRWNKNKTSAFLTYLEQQGMISKGLDSITGQTIITITDGQTTEEPPRIKKAKAKPTTIDSGQIVLFEAPPAPQKPESEYSITEKLEKAWEQFLVMRAKKKTTPTPYAQDLLKKTLKKLTNGDSQYALAIIEKSIKSNWDDFFPIKDYYQTGGHQPAIGPKPTVDQIFQQAIINKYQKS